MNLFRKRIFLYILIFAALVRAVTMGNRLLVQIEHDQHYSQQTPAPNQDAQPIL